eukprot:5293655-Prymnesium_polylepis.1
MCIRDRCTRVLGKRAHSDRPGRPPQRRRISCSRHWPVGCRTARTPPCWPCAQQPPCPHRTTPSMTKPSGW